MQHFVASSRLLGGRLASDRSDAAHEDNLSGRGPRLGRLHRTGRTEQTRWAEYAPPHLLGAARPRRQPLVFLRPVRHLRSTGTLPGGNNRFHLDSLPPLPGGMERWSAPIPDMINATPGMWFFRLHLRARKLRCFSRLPGKANRRRKRSFSRRAPWSRNEMF